MLGVSVRILVFCQILQCLRVSECAPVCVYVVSISSWFCALHVFHVSVFSCVSLDELNSAIECMPLYQIIVMLERTPVFSRWLRGGLGSTDRQW